jgi:hypothetical protein
MRLEWPAHQRQSLILGRARGLPSVRRLSMRLRSGVFLGGLTSAKTAWGARGTAFRGQWSLGGLIGSLAILGVLMALVLFLIWPRRGGE